MAESTKPAVPKFSSFKPKSTAPAQDTQSARYPTAKEENRHKDSHRDRHEDRRRRSSSKDRKRDKERHHVKSSSSSQAVVKVETSDLAIRTEDDEYVGAYRIDTSGDIANLKYRSLHRYNIPVYRRSGYGSVLGANTRAKIDRALSDEKGIVVDAPESLHKQGRRPLLKSNTKEARSMRLIRPWMDAQPPNPNQNFISLHLSKKRKRDSESPISEQGEVNYRSIEGKAKQSNEPADEDLEYLSDSSLGNEMNAELEASVRRTNAELTRRTRNEPNSLSAWIDLIEHQASLLGFMPNEALSNSEQRTLAEMRLSIFEQALKSIGKDVESKITLQLGLLEEGAKIWETSKLVEKWEQTYNANPNNSRVCIAYLSFVQTNFTGFDYEQCKAKYLKCLATINAATEVSELAKRTKAAVYIFLRLTMLIRESGYHEHAEALWQAVLELHFFRPQSLQSDSDILTSFEEFWESEVPRIGELDSKGFERFSTGDQDIPEPTTINPQEVDNIDHVFKSFANAEKETASMLFHAGRSSDETGEDDPYHIVLFPDVQPFLFPAMLRLSSAQDLVPALLLFLGLPPLPSAEDRILEKWWLDSFLTTQLFGTTAGLSAPLSNRQITSDILFSNAFDNVQLVDPSWVRRALQSLVNAIPNDDQLAEYFVAFEFHFYKESAAQTAKRLLKVRPHSLRLYNSYAIIQGRLKGHSAASRVFVTALSMASSLGADEQNITILLWRTWIFEAIRTNEVPEAIRRLLLVGTSDPAADAPNIVAEPVFPPAVMLRVKRFLTEGRDGMFSMGMDHLAVLYIELLALLVYFQTSRSLEDGLDVYAEASRIFRERKKELSPGHEHLHQAKTHFLALHHQHTTLFKPSIIRECLLESITVFPNNTTFLVAYSKNEMRFRLDDRVRAVLSEVVLQDKSDTVAGWSFAIWNEMQRGLELGGTEYGVRAVFEKAVQKMGKHNIGLWTAYFLFEISREDMRRAKQVFFRGLTNLPWAKWFIMLAFEHLDRYLSLQEMRSVWNVLGEKDLRVYVDIQDLLDEVAENAPRALRLDDRGGNQSD